MSLTSFIVAIFTTISLAIIGVIIVRSIQKKTHEKWEIRKELIRRAEKLRLPRMMQALGIGLVGYFYKVSTEDLEKNVENCENCSFTEECDEKLKIPELNPADIEFCPGRDKLAPFSRETRIKTSPDSQG